MAAINKGKGVAALLRTGLSASSILLASLLGATQGGPTYPQYDTRFGTGVDSSGWFAFGLHSGSRRVYADSARPDDTGDGLTPATAKKTYEAAKAVWLGAGYSPGDQLMLAGGTAGGTYVDAGSFGSMDGKPGVSLIYPTAVLSYDRADPTNAAKYGRLVGSQMPSLQIPAGAATFQKQADPGNDNYFAIQGIEIDGQNVSGAALKFVGRHDGLVFQNIRFKETRLVLNNGGSGFGYSQYINVSKFSGWGAWNGPDGNFSILYMEALIGPYIQDGIMAHGGWKVGANRDDPTASGGTAVFGHNSYYHASCSGGRFDRLISMDAANNGFGLRGAATATCLVSFDDPAPVVMGSYSTTPAEAPAGVIVMADDILIAGGALINSANPTSPDGINTVSSVSGSYAANVVMIDNPSAVRANLSDSHVAVGNVDLTFPTAFTMRNIRAYNYSNIAEHLNYGPTQNPANVTVTWQNAIVDSLTYFEASTSTTASLSSGISTWGSAPAGYQTKDQLYTTALTNMGLTPAGTAAGRAAQLKNALLWRNDLAGQYAAAFQWLGLPTLGLTPSKTPSTSMPNVSTDTPRTVYSSSSWTPMSLPSLKGWYDANQQTESNGAAITTLVDRSGNGNDFTGTTHKPTLSVAAINGKNAVNFDANNNQFMQCSTGLMNGATSGAWFAVVKLVNDPPTTGGGGAIFTDFGTAAAEDAHPFSDGHIYDGFGASTRPDMGNPTPSLASTALLVSISGSGDRRFLINNTTFYTNGTNTPSFSTATRNMGQALSAGTFIHGMVAEAGFMAAVPSSTDLANLVAYVNSKYGTTF